MAAKRLLEVHACGPSSCHGNQTIHGRCDHLLRPRPIPRLVWVIGAIEVDDAVRTGLFTGQRMLELFPALYVIWIIAKAHNLTADRTAESLHLVAG